MDRRSAGSSAQNSQTLAGSRAPEYDAQWFLLRKSPPPIASQCARAKISCAECLQARAAPATIACRRQLAPHVSATAKRAARSARHSAVASFRSGLVHQRIELGAIAVEVGLVEFIAQEARDNFDFVYTGEAVHAASSLTTGSGRRRFPGTAAKQRPTAHDIRLIRHDHNLVQALWKRLIPATNSAANTTCSQPVFAILCDIS